ncbi:hypothetical protein GF352_03260 [archaeon]|nr:hypothetical protein [archaeon]
MLHNLLSSINDVNYKFIRAFDEPGRFFIKYSGPKISKPKRVGFFEVDSFDFKLYSELIGDVVPLSNIEVLEAHRRNGHCLNTVSLIINNVKGYYDKLVVSNLEDRGVWEGVVQKLGVNYEFKRFYDSFEDLVIDLG